jgi:eukaryotic-like serine/threonine-protein kinase
MPGSSDGPTIDLRPGADAPTLTRAGPEAPRDAPTNFAPPGFEILSELGRGGMGVVYKARQKSLNRLVALKVILGAGHAGADTLARFRAEATTAAQLQHPNIVQVFEVGEHAGQPFFALELVEGGSLAERLKGEPLPPSEAAELARTLALAVQHAHERGVVHRDLKPGNVLLVSRDAPAEREPARSAGASRLTESVKITDFGLAKQQSAQSHLTQTGAILGTPSYMAPEQAAGAGSTVGPAADVYALGAILYELVTGRPPFKAASVMDTVLQVLHDDPVAPSRLQPKLPRDLETICLKCLAKKPEQRYASAAALADDLGRFLKGESILARPASPVARAWKWSRRHPARALALFVLAVPLPVALGVMVYLWADARAARRAAEADRAAAVAARDRADRERELAQGYLTNALGTMEKVLDRVADGPLARLPEAQEERTAILADAVAFYETLLRLDSTDPAVRFDTAQTYHRVSRLAQLAGRIDQAEAAAGNAIRLLTDLVREHPDRPAYRNELARAHMFFGHARLLSGDYDAASQAYQTGADAADALVRDAPAEPAYRSTAAECHRSLGFYYMTTRPPEAERQFREALRLAEALYAERPDAEYRALLASVLGAYGQFLVTARRLPKAEEVLDRGAALIDPKAGGPPPGGHARLNHDQAQMTTRYALALVYAMTRRADRAEALARAAVRDYEALLTGEPRAFPYRMQTVQAYSLLAQLLGNKKQHAEAAKASGRAVELIDGLFRDYPAFTQLPKGLWFQQIRQNLLLAHARGLLLAGSRDEATRFAAELNPDLPGWAGLPAYNVGCLLALLAAASDGSVRDEYAAKAMSWLKKAAAAGYPATAADVEHVRVKDDDLKVLRGRPEFGQWAKDLKPAKK